MKYLICYDISCDKRRNKISDLLENYGIRVQESVFECDLEINYLNKLAIIVKKLIKQDDSVRIYYVCKECYKKSMGFGKKPEDIFKDGYAIF